MFHSCYCFISVMRVSYVHISLRFYDTCSLDVHFFFLLLAVIIVKNCVFFFFFCLGSLACRSRAKLLISAKYVLTAKQKK